MKKHNQKHITKKQLLIMGLLQLLSMGAMAQNTKYGTGALSANATGTNNAAFGFNALRLNKTGSNNSATGYKALYSNTTGSNNTALGYAADVSTGALTNVTVIGYNAKATASNTVTIGNTNITDNYFSGNVRGGAFVKLGGTSSQYLMADGSVSTGGGSSSWGSITGTLSSQTDLQNALNSKANVVSPFFTGAPTAPTAPVGTNTNQIATTAFVLANSGNNGGIAHLEFNNTDKTVWNNGKGNKQSNTSYGEGALMSNTTGWDNTANGFYALSQNTTGFYNTANGDQALYSNTTGTRNTANGRTALFSNTTGFYNTANGDQALYSNTTGYNNTANGDQALYSNTTGYNNTANGVEALYYNTTGFYNTANGVEALYYNTTGDNNTANGANALRSNTTGDNNTANGAAALRFNTTGGANTANGFAALSANTTGNYNTANGFGALTDNTTGNGNTSNGFAALYDNTTGSRNTANGINALYSNTTGDYNTALGSYADVSSGALTNSIAIGYGATVTASNTIQLGNTSVSQIGGQVGWSTLSDGRFKENIKEDVPGLRFITKLRPVTYTLNTQKIEAISMKNMPDSLKTKRMQKSDAYRIADAKIKTGFVAQEVEKAAKALGYDFDGVNTPQNDTDHYSLTYSEFVVPLVKGMQEQQEQIEQLQKKIEQMEQQQQQIDELKKLVLKLTGASIPNVTTDDDGITLYPNPNKGIFSVSTTGTLINKIEVFNLAGIHLQTIDTINNTSCNLNLSGYPKGVYLIKINSKDTIIATKKVIIE